MLKYRLRSTIVVTGTETRVFYDCIDYTVCIK